jgi:putative addiction module component (TIGR02574 family)
MSFQELMAELPKLTVEQRQLLMRRMVALDNSALSPEEERLVEERRAEYLRNPSAGLSLEEIIRQVRHLPRAQAAELFDRLLMETFTAPDAETEAAWKQEIRRRIADIESGREPGVDGDEVMEELRKIVGR